MSHFSDSLSKWTSGTLTIWKENKGLDFFCLALRGEKSNLQSIQFTFRLITQLFSDSSPNQVNASHHFISIRLLSITGCLWSKVHLDSMGGGWGLFEKLCVLGDFIVAGTPPLHHSWSLASAAPSWTTSASGTFPSRLLSASEYWPMRQLTVFAVFQFLENCIQADSVTRHLFSRRTDSAPLQELFKLARHNWSISS